MFSKITSLFKSKKPESTPDHLPVEAAEQPLPFAAPAPNEVKQDPPAVDADAFTPASIQPEQPPAEVQDTLKVEFTAEFTSPVEFVSEHPIEPALDSSQNTPPIFEATPSFIPEQSVEAPQQQEQPAPPVNSRENTVTHQAPPEPAPSAAQSEPVKQEKLGFFARIKQGLARTTSQFAEGVGNLFLGKKAIDDELLEDLETQLLVADVGIEATTVIIDDLTGRVARKQLNDSDALFAALQENLRNLLLPVEKPLVIPAEFKPFVILVVGVNGAGKTTTIGKLAHRFLAEGKSVMLAAGDTFRAAAVEQLQVWGERNQVPVIAQHTGADSASVIFDAVQAAQSGTWAVDLGATDNAVLDAIAASLAGTLTVGSHAVTNAGTFAVQISSALPAGTNAIGKLSANSGVDIGDVDVTSLPAITGTVTANAGTNLNTSALALESGGNLAAIATSAALIDDAIYAQSASAGKFVGLGAYDSGDTGTMVRLQCTAGGELFVTSSNPLSAIVESGVVHDAPSGGANPILNGGYASAAAPTNASTDGDCVYAWHLRNGSQVCNLAVGGTLVTGSAGLPVAQQGTWNVGTVTTVTTCSTVTTVSTLTGGGVAHDGADSGNPVKVGARAAATLSDDTMVANADRTDNVADLDGALIVRPGYPLGDLITERVTNTDGSSTAFTNFGATASTRNYVTAIVVYNSSATAGTIDFRDGTSGSVLWTVPIPATGGAVITNGGSPLFYTTANTALAFDVSAALTTVTISLTGFKSKARA